MSPIATKAKKESLPLILPSHIHTYILTASVTAVIECRYPSPMLCNSLVTPPTPPHALHPQTQSPFPDQSPSRICHRHAECDTSSQARHAHLCIHPLLFSAPASPAIIMTSLPLPLATLHNCTLHTALFWPPQLSLQPISTPPPPSGLHAILQNTTDKTIFSPLIGHR